MQIAAFLLCLVSLQASQPPREPAPKPSAGIRGRATDAATGKPLRMVRVTLTPQTRQATLAPRSTRTDNDGRYQFPALPPASYVLTFTKARYADASLGQSSSDTPGRPLTLAEAQVLEGADIALRRAAAVTGRVLDDTGEPMQGAVVMAMKPGFRETGRALVTAGPSTQTDDRGQYRLAQLPPGEYYIVAQERADAFGSMSDADIGLAITAYPGTTDIRAARAATVRGGVDTAGIDIAMSPVTPATLSGVLIDETAQPAPNVEIVLQAVNSGPGAGLGGSARTAADGTFRFPRVLPGRYELHARYNVRPNQGAIVPLTIAPGADENVTVRVTTGGRMTGRVVPPDGATADPAVLRINAIPIGDTLVYGTGFGGPVAPDWTFNWDFLLGRRIIRSAGNGLPEGWYIKSVMQAEVDATDEPLTFTGSEVIDNLTIILTTDKTILTGRAIEVDGKPATSYTVIVFPEDSLRWQSWSRYLQTARPDQTGEFRVEGLPPARYLAAAVRTVQQNEWFDKDYLERLRPLATHVTLEMNRTATLSLKVVRP